MKDDTIELFYDVVSPYSYLANTQVPKMEERLGMKVRYRPFFLGGVMKATGNQPPITLAARAPFLAKDLARWAQLYGVTLRMPSRFPALTVRAQRVLLAAEAAGGQAALRALTDAYFAAYWVDDVDINDAGELARLATASGLDGSALLAASETAEIKDALRASTDEAVARGAFGAPTFLVGDALVFGNDRIAHVEMLARGELVA